MAEEPQVPSALFSVMESARNLMPAAFALAADGAADIKERWSAFDKVYAFAVEEMEKRGTPHKPTPFDRTPLTERQADMIAARSMRYSVAVTLLTMVFGNPKENMGTIMWLAEELAPTQPDPETWKPPHTGKDQVILFEATAVLREDFAEDWECFFKGDSEPVARRKLAFRRMYACVGGVWREYSEFARGLEPFQRQAMVIFALMCHVPGDQWGQDDLRALEKELLPVEEPDWEELARQVGPMQGPG